MIEIPRSLARQLGTVLRRCWPKPHGKQSPRIELQADADGLRVGMVEPEIAVEYRQAGSFGSEVLNLPLSALTNFEGRGPDTVSLEVCKDGRVIARWQDRGVPLVMEYETPDDAARLDIPQLPDKFVRNPPGLLKALDEAGQTTAGDNVRFALQRLLLRGRYGEVIATNGRELLIQGGFHFPWTDDVLVPHSAAFGCKELGADAPVEIGQLDKQVVLRVGSWTFFLNIDADGRYPKVEQVVPKLTSGATCWRIAPEDATFLARALSRLPSADTDSQPVTVDLNGEVCLRACDAGRKRLTEVVLARSSFTGKPIRFSLNRNYLGRVLHLGFDEVHIVNADTPLVAQDNQRTYVGVPLSKESALPPAEGALRIISGEAERPRATTIASERKKRVMSAPTSNGNGHGQRKTAPAAQANGKVHFGSLLAEAQALKEALREVYGRTTRLTAALRQQQRQSKLVQSTLASLQQLQQIES